MIGAEGFEQCVQTMLASGLSPSELFGFYSGDSVILAVCAAEAMKRQALPRDIRERLLASINDFHPYTRFFGLRAIAAATQATETATGLVLSAVDDSWTHPAMRTNLTDFVVERIDAGDPPRLQGLRHEPNEERCELMASLLATVDRPAVSEFLAALAELRAGRIDVEFLESIGSIETSVSDVVIVEHRDLLTMREAVKASLTAVPPRPALLVGAPGTGRSTLVEAVWRELRGLGWTLFEAGQVELLAGQSYVGQLEERVRKLTTELGRSRRTLWVAPAFQTFLFAGRHSQSPTSLLDLMLPAIVEGRFPMIAITDPAGLDLLLRSKPDILTAFEVVRLEPLSDTASLDLARAWDRRRNHPPEPFAEPLLREASHLACQYLGDMAGPGNLIQLLESVCRDLTEDGRTTATLEDIIACVGKITRLPTNILDERKPLDTAELTAFFSARVIGQPEAIETLVERVAMIKAGVTDPTRPLGVFLFAGPTGTGKTEIAKSLAEYLFGSPGRLVRLDMSELQTPESLARLLGESEQDVAGNALVDQIRRSPFSVVLLDEFEKSHPQVWDLFLQVFDDGRLTDRRGITADFRNCIIILTSNLGSTVPTGPGLGFGGGQRYSSDTVEQAVARAFRREFFNRIDRLVVFRPLSRDVLREILHKELRDVFRRRGLRNRDWVVVWDETAIDFLLDRGTTPDLGARPLKRAIERHVLAPLAKTIVERQFPQGDQFLFVRRAGDRLEAEFVDPDAKPPEPPPTPVAEGEPRRLEAIALDPRGSDDEVPCLESHLDALLDTIEGDQWRESKRTALERQREPGFWDSVERFAVFGTIEQMDRIEAATRSAAQLFDKLRGNRSAGRTRIASDHAGRLALRLFLLEGAVADMKAARPLDAFVMVEAVSSGDVRSATTTAFFMRLGGMYRSWAERRGMRIDTVVDETDGRQPRLVLAVSGFAALSLLQPEDGLHVFEEPLGEGRGFERAQVRVRVVPQPDTPPADGTGGLRAQALAAFESQPTAGAQIVRRYRERPSPLVRDSARGWRTGRIDRVFAGDFDLLVTTKDDVDAEARAV
jgi:ATP-dependent Clp protease ATP-binding subunit ClpC